jgi:hypothetical protein
VHTWKALSDTNETNMAMKPFCTLVQPRMIKSMYLCTRAAHKCPVSGKYKVQANVNPSYLTCMRNNTTTWELGSGLPMTLTLSNKRQFR